MEKISTPVTEQNGVENHEETHCRTHDVLSVDPVKSSVVRIQRDNVIVQNINYDTGVAVKSERGDGFTVDEEEGESQEDDNHRDNQGRKNISTLTSRHYAGHVRVFKGIMIVITKLSFIYFIQSFCLSQIKQFITWHRKI